MQSPSHEIEQNSPHIFVIASDAHIIKYFHVGFKGLGYNVVGNQYSVDILETVRQAKPHLIILESMLPDTIGSTLLKNLKQEEITQKCPIIVLSSSNGDQTEQEIGADAFITRPFDFNDVIALVNSFIAHLNPQFSRPIKGFIFPIDNPPPGLSHKFYKQSDESK